MKTKLKVQQEVDLLLHPRGPPLVRPLPHIEALSLFRAEESNEELAARTSIALVTIYDANVMDVAADPIAVTSSLSKTTPQPVSAMPTPRTTTPVPPTPPTVLTTVTSQQKTSPITVAPTKDSTNIRSAISSQQPVKSLPSTSSQTERAPAMVKPPLIPVATDDEEDESMPTIDMESDSDG